MEQNPEQWLAPYQVFIDRLFSEEKLDRTDLNRVSKLQSQVSNGSLPALLVKLGLCADRDIAQISAKAADIELVDGDAYPEQSPFINEVSLRFLKEYHIAGLEETEQQVTVAVMDPFDSFVKEALQLACDKDITIRVGVGSEIDKALDNQYGDGKSEMGQIVGNFAEDEVAEDDIEHLKDLASEAPVIRVVNLIFQRALETRASDIHIEPFERSLIVRLRIDGVLQNIEAPPISSTAAVISRIKLMAQLNISERRLPQDGRIKIQMHGKEIDLRVSTTPTMYGESVVIRLLDKENAVLDFTALGFNEDNAANFFEVLAQPHGIILITGPTGSGKSTTLYTSLNRINTPDRKIITAEDPVEYQLDGINQIQIKPQIGLTFSSALRSIVRQDPDVIMIGEMRDLETAKIAVQSALTGHLVLSTLHTNDAAGGVTRLLDMGLDDYLLTSTVNGILAQRLVRKLCVECREAYPVLPEMIEEMELLRFAEAGDIHFYHAVGCDQCGHIGYRGRIAIFEFLVISDPIRKLIIQHQESGLIKEEAVKEGMYTMYEDGLRKAINGTTTLEEVLRVTTVT